MSQNYSNLKLGIIGGGQLGKMLLQVTSRYNINSKILDPSNDSPCKNLCNEFFLGDLMDLDTVYEFGKKCDLVTYEIEHVNTKALEKLESEGIDIFPRPSTLKIIQDKSMQKKFFLENNIPTAKYKTFNKENIEDGFVFLESLEPPYVLKADGLAAGKGVLIIESLNEAKEELKSMLLKSKFGNASSKVVIEEFLDGVELSVFVLTNGDSYKILPTAKDYKRIGEGDNGLNTGGMGAISPVPFVDRFLMEKIEQEIIKPSIEGLKKENITYQGFLFIGLIKVGSEPKVIEYNVRMGAVSYTHLRAHET